MGEKGLYDKAVDFIFSRDARKYVIIFLIIGIVLRYTVASNVSVLADEMLHGPHAMNIISSGVINLQNQCPVWFYMTDLAYMVFGVTALGARFLSFLFGSLTILLVYLIGTMLFNKRVAVIASCLLAISAFVIRYTLMEMDIAMMFFVLLSFFYFYKGMTEKKQVSYLAAIFMGVAILIKPIAIPFLVSFALYFVFFPKEKSERKENFRRNLRKILYVCLILFFMVLPVIAYNVILYNQKGITDVLFERFFKINPEIYASLQGYDQDFSVTYFFTEGIPALFKSLFLLLDPVIFIFGLLGLFLIFRKAEYMRGRYFAVFHLVPCIFLMGTSLLQTHFTSFMPLLCLSAAVFIVDLSGTLSKHVSPKYVVYGSIALVIIVNLILLVPNITSKSAVFQMREHAMEHIVQQDIVIADARIYRGRIAWMFNDKSYIESSLFPTLLQVNANSSAQKVSVTFYFVECVPDDCGWGTIKDQADFNASSEEIASLIKNNSVQQKIFYGGGGYDEKKGEPYFALYKGSLSIDPRLYSAIYDTHEWFYYPVRWAKSDWYDKYTPQGMFQILLHSAGKFFLWVAIIIALLSPFVLIREFIKSKAPH